MQTLCRWITAVKMNYRPVACHDWRRAVLTMQTLFVMFTVLYIDRKFEFYEFFSFLKFNAFYEIFFRLKEIRKKFVILQIINV